MTVVLVLRLNRIRKLGLQAVILVVQAVKAAALVAVVVLVLAVAVVHLVEVVTITPAIVLVLVAIEKALSGAVPLAAENSVAKVTTVLRTVSVRVLVNGSTAATLVTAVNQIMNVTTAKPAPATA